MSRTLTIAALLPLLGTATAAAAQPAAQPAPTGAQPYPFARQLSWPGQAHPSQGHPNQGGPQSRYGRPTAVPAPQSPGAYVPPQSVARPPVIPHGGYPWRAAPPAYSPQPAPAPAPDFHAATNHPDATWRPYVVSPAPTGPAPYAPPPWPQPSVSGAAPASPPPAPYPASRDVYYAPQPVRTVPEQAPIPAPRPADTPPVRRQLTPEQTPPPMPEPLRPMTPRPAPAQPAPAQPRPVATPPVPPAPAPSQTIQPQTIQPAPSPEPPPAPPAAPSGPAYDPMAPRRDAPIFQLQRNAPPADAPAPKAADPEAASPGAASAPRPTQPVAQTSAPPSSHVQTAPGDAPAQGGARYYSVHRQAGRQPDSTPLPAPSYLDALPVELDPPIASDDLAQPPEAPAVIRDAQGRLRAAAPLDDPMLP